MLRDFDDNILNQIREGNLDAMNKVKGPLKGITINQLSNFGIKYTGLADEIVNDVFSEISFHKGPFNPQPKPMAYLAALSKNLICRHLRNNNFVEYSIDEKPAVIEVNQTNDWEIPFWEINETINACIGQLNQHERLLIEGVIDKRPVEELVKELGYKNKEVLYPRKSLILSKLRKLLRENGIDF